MAELLRIHPMNSKRFEWRGHALALVTATEHYGAVMNRPFRYERYLDDMAARGLNLTRTFVLFRELQSAMNPASTCKPESTEYVAPYERTVPGTARDGQPRCDLDRFSEEFTHRLREFLRLAKDRNIIVELTLLSNTYAPPIWDLNPLNAANNVNGLPDIPWPDYTSLRHPEIVERQVGLVRHIVSGTRDFGNLIYEICNEPGGAAPGVEGAPDCEEVNAWQRTIAAAIRDADHPAPHAHLIAGQEAFHWVPFEQRSTLSFRDFPVDIVNIHPLPNTTLAGRSYDMGAFMSGQLRLQELRAFCLAALAESKPLNLDEDNAATQYRSPEGWTVQRKRAWTALFCGAHYDCIDFSIQPWLEDGTPASRAGLRAWFGHLARFVNALPLERCQPLPDAVLRAPAAVVASAFGDPEAIVCVYIADAREWGEHGLGEPMAGELAIALPAGRWRVSSFGPTTGEASPSVVLESDGVAAIELPAFAHDLVVRFERA